MSGYGHDPAQPPTDPSQPYGSMPPPSEYEQAVAGPPAAVPSQVDRATKILYTLAGFEILSILFAFLSRDSIENSVRDSRPELSQSDIDSAVTVAIVISVVLGLLFAVLYYFCARKMLEARNWARITPTVLLAVGVLFGLLSLGSGSGLDLVLQAITIVLGIAFLIYSWSRPSNEFFGARRRAR